MFYLSFVLILPASVYGIGQPHYECGENGRFEYCIDGIPGCIVGCHCHPGYYFDTDTKICEPNAKLVQEFRRLYSGVGPTRVPDVILSANELDLEPTPTTTSSPIEAQVDNIAKDSDDLGDWLYNQFFKTIESQVINNTDDGATSEKPPTRRSSQDNSFDRRMQKKNKRKSKRGKKKKSDLRRKLLRITEDDSLFDSSSGSSEDSTDDSDSSSDDSSSDTSSDDGENKENNSKHDDKEHGHRKILVINKKPKPPLPSFIFLPNLETPYFAPIGLPPPPIPMYPMIPVPPMPVYPACPGAQCTPNTTSGTTKKPDTSKDSDKKPPDPNGEPNNNNSGDKIVHSNGNGNSNEGGKNTEADKNGEGKKNESEGKNIDKKKKNDANGSATANETTVDGGSSSYFFRAGANKHGQRKKLLRELQQQLNSSMRKKSKKKVNPDLPEVEPDFESPVDEGFPASSKQLAPFTRDVPHENVDFRYLAQLIHKMDNKTSNTIPNVSNHPKLPTRRYGGNSEDNYFPPSPVDVERGNVENHRHLETPDESYYTNLGHQIASLIRKIDATGEQRVNIEIERRKALQPEQDFKASTFKQTPFIMENSYAPRSYWERSVRSLLNHLQPYDDEYYPRKTHEDRLFNLERKVETFAVTTPSLSLNDLENVVALMDKSKSELQSTTTVPETTTDISEDNLNINLLPHPYEHPKYEQNNYEYEFRKSTPNRYVQKPDNSTAIKRYMSENNAQNNIRGVLLHNFKDLRNTLIKKTPSYNAQYQPKFDVKTVSAVNLKDLTKLSHNFSNLPKPNRNTVYLKNVTWNRNDIANLQRIVGLKLNQVVNSRNQLPNVPWLAPKLVNILNHPELYRTSNTPFLRQPPNMKLQLSARRRSYPTKRYLVDNTNRYRHHKGLLGLPLPVKPPHRKTEPSTYFHHEIQHLDMFKKR